MRLNQTTNALVGAIVDVLDRDAAAAWVECGVPSLDRFWTVASGLSGWAETERVLFQGNLRAASWLEWIEAEIARRRGELTTFDELPGLAEEPIGAAGGIVPASSSDEELVEQFRKGYEGAFVRLVERYQRRIFGCAKGRLGRDDAADLTQEVFLKVYRSIDSFDVSHSFGTWIFAIARNCITDRLRAKRRRAPYEELAKASDVSDHSGRLSCEESGIPAWYSREITLDQGEVVECRFGLGMTVAETAAALGRTEQAVMSVTHAAKKRFLERRKSEYLDSLSPVQRKAYESKSAKEAGLTCEEWMALRTAAEDRLGKLVWEGLRDEGVR